MIGAAAVAQLVSWSIRDQLVEKPRWEDFSRVLEKANRKDQEWSNLVHSIGAAVQHDLSVQEFADSLGLSRGVTGYVYHTVPVVVYAWYRHFGDFEATVSAVLNCGGDADTTGAIAGTLAGAVTGEQGIPEDWLNGLCEWPRGVNTMREIADQLARKSQEPSWGAPVSYFWPGLLPRNLFLLAVVILHGLRRLAPPY